MIVDDLNHPVDSDLYLSLDDEADFVYTRLEDDLLSPEDPQEIIPIHEGSRIIIKNVAEDSYFLATVGGSEEKSDGYYIPAESALGQALINKNPNSFVWETNDGLSEYRIECVS